jgi:hypothetical protein
MENFGKERTFKNNEEADKLREAGNHHFKYGDLYDALVRLSLQRVAQAS